MSSNPEELIQWTEAWNSERSTRANINPEKLCHFGIEPLDNAMPFIYPDDLIVVWADSRPGKSEVALQMAMHNCEKGKKVALFYLEGGADEAMARIKFRFINRKLNRHLDFVQWRCGKENTSREEEEIFMELKPKLADNLFIYSTGTGFTLENLLGAMYSFHDLTQWIDNAGKIQLDMIIVDHLQYFDLPNAENEITSTTKILKGLKRLASEYKVPVVLISHLRKKDKARGLPGQEDFYGSSNIPKIATCAIVLSSDKEKQDFSDGLYPTFMRFVKSRIGLRDTYAIKIDFDIKTRTYQKKYQLFYINSSTNMPFNMPIMENKLPEWAWPKKEEQKTMLGPTNKEEVSWDE